MKEFYCAYCNRIESTPSGQLPDGWYSIMRRWQADPKGFVRMGIYCSLDCIFQRIPSLHNIARKQEGWAVERAYREGAAI